MDPGKETNPTYSVWELLILIETAEDQTTLTVIDHLLFNYGERYRYTVEELRQIRRAVVSRSSKI